MKPLFYISRHIAAVGVSAITGAVLWTVIYFILLLFAILIGGGTGGPLSYPAMLTFLLIGILGIGLLVFAPSCAFGRLIAAQTKWPLITAIPFVFIAGGVLSYLLYQACIELVTTHSMPPVSTVFKNYLIYLAVPLGAYWWLTDGPFAIIDGVRRWIFRIFIPSAPPSQTGPTL